MRLITLSPSIQLTTGPVNVIIPASAAMHHGRRHVIDAGYFCLILGRKPGGSRQGPRLRLSDWD